AAPQRGLIAYMRQRSDWDLVLIDDTFAMFVRKDLATLSGYAPLTALEPDFAPAWVLDAGAAHTERIRTQLGHLISFPTAQGYRHWLLALLELAPLQRAERMGFRWPRDAADWARYHNAADHLEKAAETSAYVQAVAIVRAVAEATLCHLD